MGSDTSKNSENGIVKRVLKRLDDRDVRNGTRRFSEKSTTRLWRLLAGGLITIVLTIGTPWLYWVSGKTVDHGQNIATMEEQVEQIRILTQETKESAEKISGNVITIEKLLIRHDEELKFDKERHETIKERLDRLEHNRDRRRS